MLAEDYEELRDLAGFVNGEVAVFFSRMQLIEAAASLLR
jgi:hypothetical protein